MSSIDPIGLSTIVSRNDEPVSVEVDRSVVMMSIDQGMYYGLEGTGPRIWALLEQPRSVSYLCDAMMSEFEVEAEECRRQVIDFLEELRRSQLIRIDDEARGSAHSPSGA